MKILIQDLQKKIDNLFDDNSNIDPFWNQESKRCLIEVLCSLLVNNINVTSFFENLNQDKLKDFMITQGILDDSKQSQSVVAIVMECLK